MNVDIPPPQSDTTWNILFSAINNNRDNSGRETGLQFPTEAREFSLLQSVQPHRRTTHARVNILLGQSSLRVKQPGANVPTFLHLLC